MRMYSSAAMQRRFNLIDVNPCLKAIAPQFRTPVRTLVRALARTLATPLFAVFLSGAFLTACIPAQTAPVPAGPPPSTGGFYPLSQVHRGQMATAWTVFSGTKPEPMQVEILGVLRGARGPGQDMILAKLHGAKPEYTGVVAGMSGSPVYIGDQLLGSLSYRIGQFARDPIAGITPIAQMLEVKDMPVSTQWASASPHAAPMPNDNSLSSNGMNFQAMETPLVMSGFRPEAIRLWQKELAGTGLDIIAAGGGSGSSKPDADGSFGAISPSAVASVVPGSAVSAQLVRGDLEVSATCTVTYVDPKQLLACGHPILQAGTVSLPMTTAEVVETLASPLNAFKIINTGDPIGTFTEDRNSAIRGVLGVKPHMIPVHITVHGEGPDRKLNIEVVDLPSLTPQAILVSLYDTSARKQSEQPRNQLSRHRQRQHRGLSAIASRSLGSCRRCRVPHNSRQPCRPTRALPCSTPTAHRQGAIKAVDLDVDSIPRRAQVELETARIDSSNIVHAGDTVLVEATVRPWQQPARNIRIPINLPHGIPAGNVRLLVSDAGTLDRALNQPRISNRTRRPRNRACPGAKPASCRSHFR